MDRNDEWDNYALYQRSVFATPQLNVPAHARGMSPGYYVPPKILT